MGYRDSGAFVPTTQLWDVSQLKDIEVTSPEFKELMIRLYQNMNQMAVNLNLKDTGMYDTDEFVTGATFFSNPALTSASTTTPVRRQVYRKVVNFGALLNTAAKNVAHGLTVNDTYIFTQIYGCASDQAGLSFIPIPYSSPTLASNIEISVDNTNVTITTGSDRTAYTVCYVVLEYIKT